MDATDPGLRHQWAHAVAGAATGFAINERNDLERAGDIDDLVADDAPLVVRPRRAIIAVDCDDSRGDAALDAVIAAAEIEGVPCVVCRSGAPGHRHLFLTIGDHASLVERAAFVAWLRNAGLDVRFAGIRPPGARHRHGARSTPIRPTLSQVTAELTRPCPPGAFSALCTRLGLATLSPRMHRLAALGTDGSGYRSASEGRMAIALAAHAAGMPDGFLAALLTDPRAHIGDSFRSRSLAWQHVELGRLRDKAAARFDSRRIFDPDPTETLRTFRSAVATEAFPGRSGATTVAVAEALAAIAERRYSLRIPAPVADLAVAAGVGRAAARNALRRLCDAGWARTVAEPTATSSRVVELAVPPGVRVVERDWSGDERADLGGDAARWQALGKVAVRTWRELSTTAARSTEDIAHATSSSRLQARARLWRLAQTGLARYDAVEGGWRAVDADVADVAAAYGTAGRRERERADLARERAERRAARTRVRA